MKRLARLACVVVTLGVSVASAQNGPRDENGIPLGPVRQAVRHLRASEWQKLEDHLATLAINGRHDGDYRTRLGGVVSQLDFPSLEPDLDRWCTAAPRSKYARLVRGSFLIAHAWRARGNGWAKDVTPEGWKGFKDRLARAKTDLEAAAKADPDHAHAHDLLVKVAMGEGASAADSAKVFERGVAIDATHIQLYLNRLVALQPRWGGTFDAMDALVKKARAANPDEPALGVIELQVHLYRAEESKTYLTPAIQQAIAATAVTVEKRYPHAGPAFLRVSDLARLGGDPALAAAWLEKAALNGTDWAAARLADDCNRNGDRRGQLRWYRVRAELEEPEGMEDLAHLLGTGIGPQDPADVPAAFGWYAAAAELDNVAGDLGAGMLLVESVPGIRADAKRAVRHLTRAADAGKTQAMVYLAKLLKTGKDDVAADPAGARRWLEKAAAGGNLEAKDLLGK